MDFLRSNMNLDRRGSYLVFGLCLVGLTTLFGCGSSSDSGATSCSVDADCSYGSVCGVQDTCVSVDCRNCTAEQVCYTTSSNPEGTCSWPCSEDTDCPGDRTCASSGKCVSGQTGTGDGDGNDGDSGCETDDDCEGDKICDLNGQCKQKENEEDNDGGEETGCENDGECSGDKVCKEGSCQAPSDDGGESGPCGGCPDGKLCDTRSSSCVDNTCTPKTPGSCGSGKLLHPEICRCVECAADSDCSGEKTCNSNYQCSDPCEHSCDSSNSNACANVANRDLCLGGCCVQCIGRSDCSDGKLCIEGMCEQPPSCSGDSDCSSGLTCQGGTCQPGTGGGNDDNGGSGQQCSSQQDCPQNERCFNGRCVGLGGGGSGFPGLGGSGLPDRDCGYCNSSGGSCSCGGSLSCKGLSDLAPSGLGGLLGQLGSNLGFAQACGICQNPGSQGSCPSGLQCRELSLMGITLKAACLPSNIAP